MRYIYTHHTPRYRGKKETGQRQTANRQTNRQKRTERQTKTYTDRQHAEQYTFNYLKPYTAKITKTECSQLLKALTKTKAQANNKSQWYVYIRPVHESRQKERKEVKIERKRENKYNSIEWDCENGIPYWFMSSTSGYEYKVKMSETFLAPVVFLFVFYRLPCLGNTHTHARTHARTHTRTHARMQACRHAHTYTRARARAHTRTHARALACTHTHTLAL